MNDDPEPPDEPPPPQTEIIIEPAQMAGVWANVASITQTVHEFTLDFIRLDGSAGGTRGIVVARVAFSPLLAGQLAELLNNAWEQYAGIPEAPPEAPEGQDDESGEHPEG
jgi:hypothetical protein